MNGRQRERGHLDNRAAQDRLKGQDRDRSRVQEDDLRAVMGQAAGRRYVWRLLDDVAGVFSGTFTGSSETFYREGRRSVGIAILTELQRVAPDSYALMVTEALARTKDDAVNRKGAEQVAQENDDE